MTAYWHKSRLLLFRSGFRLGFEGTGAEEQGCGCTSAHNAPAFVQVRSALRGLVLRNEDVTAYEHTRKAKEGEVSAPWPIRWTYNFLCFSLDILYKNRPIQR